VTAVLNIAYWILVATRWQLRFRSFIARRHGVTITTGFRGFWRAQAAGSTSRLLGIELLQLAYFMLAFIVWSGLLSLALGAMFLLELWTT
jgi:hypothetical protein